MELKITTEREVMVLTIALQEAFARFSDQARWLRNSHLDAVGCIEDYENEAQTAKALLEEVATWQKPCT